MMLFSPGEPTYGAVGGTAVLTPDSVDGPITSIVWKHNGDMAMNWYEGDEVESFRHFTGTFTHFHLRFNGRWI